MTGNFLQEKCVLENYTDIVERCTFFDCDHSDLNDFFAKDAINYTKALLGKTYCFTLIDNPEIIVSAFTVANDSVKTTHLPNNRRAKLQKNIPREKIMRSYPAVLIGRLGVNKDYARMGIGCEVLDFIKAWFIDGANKTGCRFIVVDAYNEPRPLTFYEKNGFKRMFSSDEQEKENLGLEPAATLNTRLMHFDLIALRNGSV